MDIQLTENSNCKEVQELYKAGFTFEQIKAITSWYCAIHRKEFTLFVDDEGNIVGE